MVWVGINIVVCCCVNVDVVVVGLVGRVVGMIWLFVLLELWVVWLMLFVLDLIFVVGELLLCL